ncbi:MAG: porin [Gallionella sp.]|nr:porin [Gallionella sp.]
MQKKIIALAIASALTVPALAQAEATVYGQANVSFDRVATGESTTAGVVTKSATQNQLVSNNSRLGLKGSDDLGGGLSAVWQMEGTIGMDDGTSALFNRNTYVGVKSADLGSVLLGNYDTPYKVAFRKLDVFADSAVADNRTRIFMADARRKNSINYISPSFSGVTVAFASVFGAEGASGAVGAGTEPKKGSATSLSGTFEQGPIYAALAIDNVKVGNATGDLSAASLSAGTGYLGYTGWAVDDKVRGMKLGGGYTMDKFVVNAIIEKAKITIAATVVNPEVEVTGTNIYVGGKFNISSTDAVKLAYGKVGESTSKCTGCTGKNEDSVKQITVGYDHSMSKATSVYALYTKVTNQDTAAAKTADPSALSLGMKHAF